MSRRTVDVGPAAGGADGGDGRAPGPQDPVLQCQAVAVRYGRAPEVLRDIDLTLKPGSFHFLTGPSGAGKSSLLKLAYMAHAPSRGVVRLFGQDTAGLTRRAIPAIRRRIGVVYQEYRLLDHLSVFDNTALPLRVAGRPADTYRDNVVELLTWVGLGQRMHALPPTLSGGEKQRLAIARAVVAGPELLLADEPTGNVDPEMGRKILRLLLEMNRMGTTVLVSTHDRALVNEAAMPELRIDNGRLVRVTP